MTGFIKVNQGREGSRERAVYRRAGRRRKEFGFEGRRGLFGGRGGIHSQCLHASIAVLSVWYPTETAHMSV